MKEKIKELLSFIKKSLSMSLQGKLGFLCLLLSIFFFVRLFCGEASIQRFLVNIWDLKNKQTELISAQADLQQLQHHVYMLQHPNSSSDYIEEVGLKVLNLGNPNLKELKHQ